MNGQLRTCGRCGLRHLAASPECKYCREPNPEYTAPERKPEPVPAAAVAAQAVPAGNQYLPGGMICPRGHLYDGAIFSECPKCNRGGGGSRMSRLGPFGDGMPPGLMGRMGPFLGPGR